MALESGSLVAEGRNTRKCPHTSMGLKACFARRHSSLGAPARVKLSGVERFCFPLMNYDSLQEHPGTSKKPL